MRIYNHTRGTSRRLKERIYEPSVTRRLVLDLFDGEIVDEFSGCTLSESLAYVEGLRRQRAEFDASLKSRKRKGKKLCKLPR